MDHLLDELYYSGPKRSTATRIALGLDLKELGFAVFWQGRILRGKASASLTALSAPAGSLATDPPAKALRIASGQNSILSTIKGTPKLH